MRTKALTCAVFCMAVISTGISLSGRTSVKAREFPQDQGSCEERFDTIYGATASYLGSSLKPTSEGISAAVGSAVSDFSPSDLVVLSLGVHPGSTFLVGCSCGRGANDFLGRFRIFQRTEKGYSTVANSETLPLSVSSERADRRVDGGFLEAMLLPSSDPSRSYFVTVWTRGGARPAPFSIVAWEWNGHGLQPIWSKKNVRNGTVKIFGPLILVVGSVPRQAAVPGNAQEAETVVYRLDGRSIADDGPLTKALVDKYVGGNLLPAGDSRDLDNLAYLRQSAGEVDLAIALYERAAALDTNREFGYLYPLIADLSEEVGNFGKAAGTLEKYLVTYADRFVPSSSQRVQSRIDLLQRIESLQRSGSYEEAARALQTYIDLLKSTQTEDHIRSLQGRLEELRKQR